MHRFTALTGLAAVAVAAACSAGPDPGPVFDDEGALPVTCMAHQPAAPGTRYQDPALQDTGETLALLRYYTAHGALPYCDGAPPTDTDRAWATLYVDLGGSPERVPTALARP